MQLWMHITTENQLPLENTFVWMPYCKHQWYWSPAARKYWCTLKLLFVLNVSLHKWCSRCSSVVYFPLDVISLLDSRPYPLSLFWFRFYSYLQLQVLTDLNLSYGLEFALTTSNLLGRFVLHRGRTLSLSAPCLSHNALWDTAGFPLKKNYSSQLTDFIQAAQVRRVIYKCYKWLKYAAQCTGKNSALSTGCLSDGDSGMAAPF
jgi:hypothetical protein